MNCKCKPCNENVLLVKAVSQTDTDYFLVVEGTTTPKNGCKYIVVIPCNVLPASDTLLPVSLAINFRNYRLRDKCIGNDVYNDQLRFIPRNARGNQVIRVVFGSNPEHFKIISQDLPQSYVIE